MKEIKQSRADWANTLALTSEIEEAAIAGDARLVLALGSRIWARALGIDRTWVFAVQDDEEVLRCISSSGPAAVPMEGSEYRLSDLEVVLETIRRRMPLLQPVPREWEVLSPGPLLVAPVFGVDKAAAVLVGDAAGRGDRSSSPEWLQMAGRAAVQLSLVLKTAERVATADETVTSLEARIQELEGVLSDRQRDQRLANEQRELLRRATNRLHTVLDELPQGLIIVDAPSGAVVLANRAAQKLLRLDGDGHPTYRLARADGSRVPPGTLPGQGALLGQHCPPEEITVEVADGQTGSLLVSASPLLDASGRVEEAVVVLQDVSRLKEVDRLKSVIVSLVSHELRTPLHHIKGFSSTLLSPDLTLDEGTRRDLIESIEQEANRMIGMVTDMLDLAKIEAGEAERAEKLPIDSRQLIWSTVRRFEPAAQGRTIQIDAEDSLPEVPVDGGRIERVLTNLLENAVRFSPPGGTVVISARTSENDLVIRVIDQGTGIKQEERDRVFDRFYRGKGVTGGGAGLGLNICKAIVLAHGGQIWIEDNFPTGATIAFSLPLAPERA